MRKSYNKFIFIMFMLINSQIFVCIFELFTQKVWSQSHKICKQILTYFTEWCEPKRQPFFFLASFVIFFLCVDQIRLSELATS